MFIQSQTKPSEAFLLRNIFNNTKLKLRIANRILLAKRYGVGDFIVYK